MLKSTVNNIISGKPFKSTNKYMLEEVYFSDACKNVNFNPQNAKFIDGRYYYDLPALWYNTLDVNKAIALRKIDLRAETLNINFDIKILRTAVVGDDETRTIPIKVIVQPGMSAYMILKDISSQVSKIIASKGTKQWRYNPAKTVRMEAIYNYDDSVATLNLERTYVVEKDVADTHHFSFEITNLNEDAEKFFRWKINQKVAEKATRDEDGNIFYLFNNIWNREFLFVHASFVNGTSFNYLGRSGEFYPKPSKMYKFGGSSQQFYFQLSYDGMHPITDQIGVFCIDLAFIYHDKDYQAE